MEAKEAVFVYLDQSDVQQALKSYVVSNYPEKCTAAQSVVVTCIDSWKFTVTLERSI